MRLLRKRRKIVREIAETETLEGLRELLTAYSRAHPRGHLTALTESVIRTSRSAPRVLANVIVAILKCRVLLESLPAQTDASKSLRGRKNALEREIASYCLENPQLVASLLRELGWECVEPAARAVVMPECDGPTGALQSGLPAESAD